VIGIVGIGGMMKHQLSSNDERIAIVLNAAVLPCLVLLVFPAAVAYLYLNINDQPNLAILSSVYALTASYLLTYLLALYLNIPVAWGHLAFVGLLIHLIFSGFVTWVYLWGVPERPILSPVVLFLLFVTESEAIRRLRASAEQSITS